MTLSAGTVSLGVKGDAKGFGAKLAQDIKGQSGTFSDLGKHVGSLIVGGLGLAGVAVSVGEFFKTGFTEASDASAGVAQLAAGIKSTGNAAGVSVQGMTDLAASIQGMSGQTDDSIVKAEQLLLTFTNIKNSGPNKVFDQATQAAADMAAKMGGDASSNAILLGKALNDPAKGLTALTRVGVSFTQGQKDQIAAMVKSGDTAGAQGVILKELQTEFGGAAKAAGDTLPGQLAKGKRAFEDLSQSVVETLLPIVMPAISGVAGALRSASPYITRFASDIGEKITAGVKIAQPYMAATVDAAKALGVWLTTSAIPAVEAFGVKIEAASKWVADHKQLLVDVAGVIGVLLLPVWVSMGVTATTSAAASVAAWVAQKAEAITSAASQLASHYVVVAGWVAHAAAAVATGVTNGLIWAQLYAEAAAGAIKTVAQHVFVAVSGWGAQALAAISAGLTIAGVWAEQALQAVIGAAKVVGGLLVVAGGWIASAATATASGIVMAAAWVVGLGPIAWIIAGIVAVGAAFVLLYNKVGWFRDGVNLAWHVMQLGFGAVKDWLIGAWNNTMSFFSGIPGRLGAIFGAVGNFITAPFKAAFNAVARIWNSTVGGLSITVPGWVPGIGGNTFGLPHLPMLAEGATILPTPGGTVVRVAEAGRAESVVDTGKLNKMLDRADGTGRGAIPDYITLVDSDGTFIARMRTEAMSTINGAAASSVGLGRQMGAAR